MAMDTATVEEEVVRTHLLVAEVACTHHSAAATHHLEVVSIPTVLLMAKLHQLLWIAMDSLHVLRNVPQDEINTKLCRSSLAKYPTVQ